MRHKSQQFVGAPDLFMPVMVQALIVLYLQQYDSDSGDRAQNANMRCDMNRYLSFGRFLALVLVMLVAISD